MRRYGLRDDQWDRIKGFFLHDREGMLAAMRRTTGCSWKPFFTNIERVLLGPICPSVAVTGRSCTSALADGRKSGVFECILKLLASDHDNVYRMTDATIVRAHQHSTGAKKTANKPSADRMAD